MGRASRNRADKKKQNRLAPQVQKEQKLQKRIVLDELGGISMPVGYVPIDHAYICGFRVHQSPCILAFNGRPILLVGKGPGIHIWLYGIENLRGDLFWMDVIKDSVPQIKGMTFEENVSYGSYFYMYKGTKILEIRQHEDEYAVITYIDLQTFGLPVFGSGSELSFENQSISGNYKSDWHKPSFNFIAPNVLVKDRSESNKSDNESGEQMTDTQGPKDPTEVRRVEMSKLDFDPSMITIDPLTLTIPLHANHVDVSIIDSVALLDFVFADPAIGLGRVDEDTPNTTKIVARITLSPNVVGRLTQGLLVALANFGLFLDPAGLPKIPEQVNDNTK